MLSPQGPQRSSHSIARVQRRGDRPPHSIVCVYLENMRRQGILVFY
jgi:hypothetical protein